VSRPIVIPLLGFIILFVLHHDFWNWDRTELRFGFLPVGLAWHAGFSVVAALFWLLVSRLWWPEAIERWADEPDD
jgi:hypothetical protein